MDLQHIKFMLFFIFFHRLQNQGLDGCGFQIFLSQMNTQVGITGWFRKKAMQISAVYLWQMQGMNIKFKHCISGGFRASRRDFVNLHRIDKAEIPRSEYGLLLIASIYNISQ